MTGTAEGVTVGEPPIVTQTSTRAHCERCGGAVEAEVFHECKVDALNEGKAPLFKNELHFDGSLNGADLTKFGIVAFNETLIAQDGSVSLDEKLKVAPPEQHERLKYEEMWKHPQYRKVAPGEHIAQHFLEIARPRPGAHVIDFGCGTGRGTFMLGLWGKQLKVTMLDFAGNALDQNIRDILDGNSHIVFPGLTFLQHDLTQPVPVTAEYGFCTDVMEHIPPSEVDLVLTNILRAAQHVFFQISCVEDSCGELIGHQLHLSVNPPGWWLSKFAQLGCQVHYFRDLKDSVLVYVTAWATGKEIADVGVLNVELEKIRQNVKTNMGPPLINNSRPDLPSEYAKAAALVLLQSERIRNELQLAGLPASEDIIHAVRFNGSDCTIEYVSEHADHVSSALIETKSIELKTKDFCSALVEIGARWKQVFPHQPNNDEVIIVGGGPSANAHLETIRQLRAEGKKLVTLNGAYNWALEHGLKVSATVVVDARPFNARFTRPVQPDTVYLIGSQVDPSVLEGLPHERTYLWHTTAEDVRDILETMAPDAWFGVVGGCTVLLRAIPLLRMLGYSRFHLFGCDSCVEGIATAPPEGLLTKSAVHHSYPQPENDENVIYPVIVGGKTFHCTAWHIAQAQNFIDMIRVMGEMFELEIYGDGLLAWILQHGYDIDVEAEQMTPLEKQRANQL